MNMLEPLNPRPVRHWPFTLYCLVVAFACSMYAYGRRAERATNVGPRFENYVRSASALGTTGSDGDGAYLRLGGLVDCNDKTTILDEGYDDVTYIISWDSRQKCLHIYTVEYAPR